MAEKRIESGVEAAEAALSKVALPPGGAEWLKAVSEAPATFYANLYRESFGALARALQAQADFAKGLAECKGPVEALSCQFDFLRSASTACTEEAQRAYQSLQSTLTSASS